MARMEIKKLALTSTGSAGSAVASGQLAVPNSTLFAVYFNFNSSAPNTTDTTLSAPGNGDVPSQTILTLTNNNTDAWFYPRRQIENNVGSAVTGAYDEFFVPGSLLLEIAQADALTDVVIAYLVIRTAG